MHIVFDMDNTLADEFGSTKRPGIIPLLSKLKQEGHQLSLWTSSEKFRAIGILKDHDLKRFFTTFVYREDYDPENKGAYKDIRRINGDLLIDDDPKQINFMKSIKKKGILVKAYRKNMNLNDSKDLLKSIHSNRSLFSKIFS